MAEIRTYFEDLISGGDQLIGEVINASHAAHVLYSQPLMYFSSS
jgi:hypothetical protein